MLVTIKIVEKRVIKKTYDVDYDFEAFKQAAKDYEMDYVGLIGSSNVDVELTQMVLEDNYEKQRNNA